MILGTVGLLAGFILVLFLLAIVLIRSHTAVVTKFILVVLISSFYWVQYQSLLQYRGWPTTDQLPDEFILIASEVQEPDPRRGIEGGMYWWVRESDNLQQPPRVYQLPYQEEIHQQADNVIKEQEQGAQYVGRRGEAGAQSGGFGVSFERISKSSRYKKQ